MPQCRFFYIYLANFKIIIFPSQSYSGGLFLYSSLEYLVGFPVVKPPGVCHYYADLHSSVSSSFLELPSKCSVTLVCNFGDSVPGKPVLSVNLIFTYPSRYNICNFPCNPQSSNWSSKVINFQFIQPFLVKWVVVMTFKLFTCLC